MKVTVTERKFTLPIAGIEYTLTEQEARELWLSLREHFVTPEKPLELPYQTYPPIWHPASPPLKVTCEQTQVPPGISVG